MSRSNWLKDDQPDAIGAVKRCAIVGQGRTAGRFPVGESPNQFKARKLRRCPNCPAENGIASYDQACRPYDHACRRSAKS